MFLLFTVFFVLFLLTDAMFETVFVCFLYHINQQTDHSSINQCYKYKPHTSFTIKASLQLTTVRPLLWRKRHPKVLRRTELHVWNELAEIRIKQVCSQTKQPITSSLVIRFTVRTVGKSQLHKLLHDDSRRWKQIKKLFPVWLQNKVE